ncbi:class I SAM-dependent methyltransferase [Entomospira culicis]|uniref:Class I SAM-dependent methyltransferase n=1 Tax=Entomospira culicis TaxID=2719989 RepID=A0A968KV51_9SPIO|nr:class I SAM-dependent methyltransferase [Entomospira culicis]NIZ19295.1 class I SAM-dependent methyltransferase [Entomospira culicis]NIZ69800.1 class I SAM-dependent methyltransferase [Entomospira culicis]WDI36909.1 class I SAM-dependent methyltransferase [Entomospira culicis]WDI38538.1 class I SAM-dependent methyltransferase [Entomospira culicis]
MAWFEDELFWLKYKEMMFDPDRLAATPTDVEQMIALANLPKKAVIYDHCCGFGRHALEFAKLGYAVTGVDRCTSYLDLARGKAKKRNLNVEFIEADIRSFVAPDRFDFAYNFFTSLGYIEDAEEELQALRNVYTSLKSGGSFLIDIEGKETLAKNFCESQWFDGQDGSIMMVGARILDGWSRVENRWGYVKDGVYEETIFSHKIYSAWELGTLLNEAGFSEVEFFGSLEGTPYDQDAERLIVLAHKS